MKKFIILLFSIGLGSVMLTSCLEEYLDKAPESGLSEDLVFTTYTNFMSYLNGCYTGVGNSSYDIRRTYPIRLNQYSWGIGREIMTDMSDNCLRQEGTVIKGGNMGGIIDYFTFARCPILYGSFSVVRRCNVILDKVDMLTDAVQEDIDDIKGQAHFLRAFATFEVFRWWGPMPYITKVVGVDDQWDMPRLSKHETLMKIAADMDTAYSYFEKAGRVRRDPQLPSSPGHLTHQDMHRPNGVAAKAAKARALLYAASPLNNEHGVADWQDAAIACWEALQIADQYGYALMTAANYKLNYIGTTYTNEMFLGYAAGNNIQNLIALGPPNECPTQNAVDMFETRWGDPLNTEAERNAAATMGHYNEQAPFANRDPRFYIDIVYNTCPLPGLGTAKIYWEKVGNEIKYGELFDKPNYLSITNTGYYLRKTWLERNLKNVVTKSYSDPVLRYGELLLNYAEAANEAYGPNTPAPGATMTAVDAINKIRGRWTAAQLAPVQAQFTVSTETFRPRIKNERNVELSWEGHYFNDIRRWMDAPVVMSGKVAGVDIEKVPVSTEYPTGYKYTRFELPPERQVAWKDAMYYWPFGKDDNYKMKNFVPNEVW